MLDIFLTTRLLFEGGETDPLQLGSFHVAAFLHHSFHIVHTSQNYPIKNGNRAGLMLRAAIPNQQRDLRLR